MSQPEPEPEVVPEAEPEAEPEPESSAEPEVWVPGGSYEPEPAAEFSSDEEKYLWISLYAICMILIVTGDLLIIISIMKNKDLKKKVSNLFLLSLIFARTLIGVFVVPTRITALFSEDYLESVACKLCHFSALGSSATSVLSVVAVAMDKYVEFMRVEDNAEKDSDGELEKKRVKKAKLVITGIWLLGHAYAIRNAFTVDMVDINGIMRCTSTPDKAYLSKWFLLVDLLCLLVAPLCIITICYTRVIRVSLGQQNPQSLRTSQMLIVVMMLFVVCNIPPYTIGMLDAWSVGKFNIGINAELGIFLGSYSNSWLNVLVYLKFRLDIRQSIKMMFGY